MSTFLTNKRVMLNQPGTELQQLYYNSTSFNSDSIEITYEQSKHSQTLNSLTFGSTTNILLPNEIISECYLSVELQDVVPNQTLPRGWLFSMIQEVRFLISNSNTSSLSLSGEAMFAVAAVSCGSTERRNALFKAAGEEKLAPNGKSSHACIPLILPWSVLCPEWKKDLDFSLLQNNSTITIVFKGSNSIYGGSGIRPNQFLSARFHFRGGRLSDQSNSLRGIMESSPDLIYSYPFIYHQPFDVIEFTASTQTKSLQLNSFINSDLTCMLTYFVKKSDVYPSNNSSPCPFNFIDPKVFIMSLNSNIFYQSFTPEERSVFNMCSGQEPVTLANSKIRSGSAAPFLSDPFDNTIIVVDRTKFRTVCFPGEFANVSRISNQTVRVDVSFEPEYNNESMLMYTVYSYNAILSIQGGSSYLYFD